MRDHGLEYLLAATVLAGILQIVAGMTGVAQMMRFVSRSVMTGFVNALAILIFLAQIPELTGVPMLTICHGRSRAGHHLPAADGDEGGAEPARLHRCAHRRLPV